MKCQGILFLASHLVWERVPLLVEVMLVQKTFTKELISAVSSLALLAKNLSSMDLKTGLWSVNSQGVFITLISGNPV